MRVYYFNTKIRTHILVSPSWILSDLSAKGKHRKLFVIYSPCGFVCWQKSPRVFQPPVLSRSGSARVVIELLDDRPPKRTTRLFHLDEFEHDSEIHQGEIRNTSIIFLEGSFGLEVFFFWNFDLVFFFVEGGGPKKKRCLNFMWIRKERGTGTWWQMFGWLIHGC